MSTSVQIFEEKLIEEVRKRPYLYDLSHYNYKRHDLKEKAWREISEKLGKDASMCRNRWKNLRDHFKKLNRKMARSGSGIQEPKTKWPYFGILQFLKQCADQNPTVSSLGNLNPTSEGEEEVLELSGEESLSPRLFNSPSSQHFTGPSHRSAAVIMIPPPLPSPPSNQFSSGNIMMPPPLPSQPSNQFSSGNMMMPPPLSTPPAKHSPQPSSRSNSATPSPFSIESSQLKRPHSTSNTPRQQRHNHVRRRAAKEGDDITKYFKNFLEVAQGTLSNFRPQESPREIVFKTMGTKLDKCSLPEHLKDLIELEIQTCLYEKIRFHINNFNN